MTPAPKKRKVVDVQQHSDAEFSANDSSDEASQSGSESEDSSTIDTDTEIALAQMPGKSKKTAKRKRRAVSPTPFGRALTALLETETTTTQPLALRPSIAQKKNDEKLEMRAKKVLHDERRQREEKGRIKDVIGGWGGESERALRKVAQRGVVKLFNMIQQVQASEDQPEDDVSRHRFIKKSHSKKDGVKETAKDKTVHLGQDDFLNMIKSGGIVLKN